MTDDWKIESDLKLVKLEHGNPPTGEICKNAGVKVCVDKASIAGEVREGIEGTRAFVTDLFASVQQGVAAGKDLRAVYKETYAALKPKYGHWVIFDHCMPFDVTRAYDEATQYPDPRIWTAERDQEMWEQLES